MALRHDGPRETAARARASLCLRILHGDLFLDDGRPKLSTRHDESCGLINPVGSRSESIVSAPVKLDERFLPHLIGAPQPARIGGPVPPELAGHFVAASLVTAAIFWCALGWLSGTFWQRLGAK